MPRATFLTRSAHGAGVRTAPQASPQETGRGAIERPFAICVIVRSAIAVFIWVCLVPSADAAEPAALSWTLKSSRTHDFPPPNAGDQQTCLVVADFDGDGNPDILIGEMGSPGAGDQARILLWLGDGGGNFRRHIVRIGQGIHEGALADVNGDGRPDILVKPYRHNAPLMEILLNHHP